MTSVVMTSMVDVRTGTVVVGFVLIRCLLVTVDETSELEGTVEAEEDVTEVCTELEAEGFMEFDSALDVEDRAELWVVLDIESTLELDVTLEMEGTAEVVSELDIEEVPELAAELMVEEVETTAEGLELEIKLDVLLVVKLDTDVIIVECELED